MISYKDDFHTLSRTLSSNPHKSVLIKNAYQCQHELSKMGLGSPNPQCDMTLVCGRSLRARMMDLQPLNDPFILDNIFKSPKKRRRGLLSWSAMAPESHERPTGNIWDFPRHVRARNRRRSIMGSKYSTSIRRRRARPSVGEHTRSASDPTAAISPRTHEARVDESDTSVESLSPHARPFIATTPSLPRTSFMRGFEPPEPPEPTYQPLVAFPELRDDASLRSSSVYRVSQTFTHNALKSVSGLTQPEPAVLRSSTNRKPALSSSDSHVEQGSQAVLRVMFDPNSGVAQCPRASLFEMEPSRFNMVKDSLDIRQPARTRDLQYSPARKTDVDCWPLPLAVRILRRIAVCGGLRKR
ncbi:hypothetical protein IW148_002071 [Coemansia sp. RSA 1199]|nr:hypothetical protein IW148_002071 [Coemansia sp. RSA 1199]